MPDALAEAAWRSFVTYAATSQLILDHYREETGRSYPSSAATDALEAAIDRATGVHGDAAEHFMLWVTREYWGEDEAPEKVREKLRELAA